MVKISLARQLEIVAVLLGLLILASHGDLFANSDNSPLGQTVPTRPPTPAPPPVPSGPPASPPESQGQLPADKSSGSSLQSVSPTPTLTPVPLSATITPTVALSTTLGGTSTPPSTVFPTFSFTQPTVAAFPTIPPLGSPTPDPAPSQTPSLLNAASAPTQEGWDGWIVSAFVIFATVLVLGVIIVFRLRTRSI